jgi:hypothetical protein
MDDKKLERLGGWAGIVFVVLVVVAGFLPGSPPNTSDSVGKISRYFVDKADEIRIVTYLGGLATIAVLFWLAALYRMLRRVETSPILPVAALAGGIVTTALVAVGGVIIGAVAILTLQSGIAPVNIRLFYVLGNNLTLAGGFSIIVLLLAASWAIVRSHVMPVWVAAIGAVDALLWVVGTGAVTSTKDFIFYFGFAGFLGFALWALIVSIMMLRAPGAAPAATPVTVSEPSVA